MPKRTDSHLLWPPRNSRDEHIRLQTTRLLSGVLLVALLGVQTPHLVDVAPHCPSKCRMLKSASQATQCYLAKPLMVVGWRSGCARPRRSAGGRGVGGVMEVIGGVMSMISHFNLPTCAI